MNDVHRNKTASFRGGADVVGHPTVMAAWPGIQVSAPAGGPHALILASESTRAP